jgi:ABC-2 type transport system ATP-binding protein
VSSAAILQVAGVAKTYAPPPRWLRPFVKVAAREPVLALRGLDLTVGRGEIVGLVGPNGAGKTTLIKVIASLLRPTRGRVTIADWDVQTQRAAACRHLGLVLEGDRGLYGRLSGRQNLEFFGVMSGLARRAARERAGELLELFDLAHRDKLVFAYSAGMRMRLSLARALLADPSLIVLDEPTRSLDPLGSRAAMGLLRELAEEGRAVLLSSHRLDEVAATCSRVVVLVDGEVRFCGQPDDVRRAEAGAGTALADLIEREAASGERGP